MKQITKLFSLLFLSTSFLGANEQLILVLSQDFNDTHGQLTRYERTNKTYLPVSKPITVNLGRSGLAWGLGLEGFTTQSHEPHKREGDGKAPAGIFKITEAFGYAPALHTKMPYIQAKPSLICVDDVTASSYNTFIEHNSSHPPKSFEWMHRQDDLYKIGLIVAHNVERERGAGSCIFFHIQKADNAPTAGCSAMKERDLKDIISWLDPTKKPKLVQIPRSYCTQAQELFPGLICH